ncbi:AAA family ATPase [Aristophania vespae]|uniref:Gluconokinase n=2 Tax=Aristophania vespae TaxID=2697033 RepID=A0A6P1NL40_9PROT|nr:gluconokinase [Aristophania vespae]QHI96352.1 AAA family ATPase [Aristophania vespae]
MQKENVSYSQEVEIAPHYLVVMGVSGTGKTTLAKGLAERLNWPFQEGDALHPLANVEKMKAGQPLNDEDRAPWLKLCHDWLAKEVTLGRGAVLTCSALKRKYRDVLAQGLPVQFLYLSPEPEIVKDRLVNRVGHYMPPSLLPSQYATLEEPTDDEPVIKVTSLLGPAELLDNVVGLLKTVPAPEES